MRRRQFITLLGGATATWPVVARAQQPVPIIGFLHTASPATAAGELVTFRQGLSEMGWIDGKNVALEFAWAEGNFDRLPALAADLVRRQPSIIFASSVAGHF